MATRLSPTVFLHTDPLLSRLLSRIFHTLAVSCLSDDIPIPASHGDLSTCSVRQLDSAFVPLEPFRLRASEFFDIVEASIIVLRPRPVLRRVFYGWRNGRCERALLYLVRLRRVLRAQTRYR